MQRFKHGQPIELVARVEGAKSPVSVVIESLQSNQEEVEVQLRLFALAANGEYRLNLPTHDLPRGAYDLEVAAVRGEDHTTLVRDSFVLN